MRIIADFHIHSKYSRATSTEMDVEHLADYARLKGITLLGTGDFTHPVWLAELKTKLKNTAPGLYQYNGIYFVLTGEVSTIFSVSGELKRVHLIIFAPSFEVVEKLNVRLATYGRLTGDGRPTLSISARDLTKLVLDICPDCLVVPAHAWTPWFSVFGANSGFDSLSDCFLDQTENIYAIETGLSSDPAMNWRLSSLDRITLLSNSDAHSPTRIGREANVFDCDLDYYQIMDVIKTKDKKRFLYTIEFFPEEGKYHYDGHRNCGIRVSPKEAIKLKNICPKCGKRLTTGVLHRVEELADRPEIDKSSPIPDNAIPYKNLVPLEEIIAQAFSKETSSIVVQTEYRRLVEHYGSEFAILLDLDEGAFSDGVISPKVKEALFRVRRGELTILPGYDGEYGKICIFGPEEKSTEEPQIQQETQLDLF